MSKLNCRDFLVTMTLCVSTVSFAAEHVKPGLTPTLVGAEGNGTQIHIGFTPNPTNCLYSGVYFGGATAAERNATLSTALAAKLAGKTLRIAYSQASSGAICNGSSIYVE